MGKQSTTTPGTYNTPGWGDGARIQWYGERGIVNALVSRITRSPDFVTSIHAFLQAIRWADGNYPAWIDSVVDARFLVEVGLADFGNPDLMVACRVEGEEWPFLLFLEAKARPYPLSAGNNSSGMTAGYNSTINGQLSLKYRFACALASSAPRQGMTKAIAEPRELFEQYQSRLRDYSRKPRHLLKGTVLDTLQGLGLVGLPDERCYYVAFTWDDGWKRVFHADEDSRPLFLSTTGVDRFAAMASRYGWLGYGNVAEALSLEADIEYQNACHGMLSSPVPTTADYRQARSLKNLSPVEKQFVRQVLDLLAQVYADYPTTVKHHSGSLSVLHDGIPIVKVIPEEGMFIGIRDTVNHPLDRTALPVKRSIKKVLFHGFTFDPMNTDLTTNQNLKTLVEVIAGQIL
jgi:hypothetical protein